MYFGCDQKKYLQSDMKNKLTKILLCLCTMYLFLLLSDEFEASAMPKAKETEAQSEPEDGEEDGREEGKFFNYKSSIITDCNAETLVEGKSKHYSYIHTFFACKVFNFLCSPLTVSHISSFQFGPQTF